jgi:hypothetical protein
VPSVTGSNSSMNVSQELVTLPLQLVASTPPIVEDDRVAVIDNAPENERPTAGTGALVSSLAEIDAIKKVTN